MRRPTAVLLVALVAAPIALADGSVRQVSAGIRPETWWALCTPAGGEVLPEGLD